MDVTRPNAARPTSGTHAAADTDVAVSRIAAAIGEPARARILYCLMANRARTATELASVAEVSPSTASAHLNRLKAEGLVNVVVQGKHRYFSIADSQVADVLESLSVLAGGSRDIFVPNTPEYLRAARTCYDHVAGTLGVALHDRFTALAYIAPDLDTAPDAYLLTTKGATSLARLGVDVKAIGAARRRFAFACLDWSERRSHIGGALGAALLALSVRKRWVAHDGDTRALRVTALGHREFAAAFGVKV
jgi:DNA-binding transcriptional ArsR family regulator